MQTQQQIEPSDATGMQWQIVCPQMELHLPPDQLNDVETQCTAVGMWCLQHICLTFLRGLSSITLMSAWHHESMMWDEPWDRLMCTMHKVPPITCSSLSLSRPSLPPCTLPPSPIRIADGSASEHRMKTWLLQAHTKCDSRVRIIVFAIKEWSKSRQIGDASEGFWIHMVILCLYWITCKHVLRLSYLASREWGSARTSSRRWIRGRCHLQETLFG